MSTDQVLFNLASFIAGLYLIERGADLFVDNTALLATRLGVPEVLIALLTAGAEWEELAVVVASLVQRRPQLAIGNVVGSTISNILGAFSIGLLFQPGWTVFDRSSKLYTVILFVVTTAVVILSLLGGLGQISGGLLVAGFALYVGLVCWSIYCGILAAPEDLDCDCESDSDASVHGDGPPGDAQQGDPAPPGERSALLPSSRQARSVLGPLLKLMLGFLALSLSGYILSHSAGTLAEYFGISESVFGATLLSFATTLPEKVVAVFSGSRGHSGILVASTVGSNIFLLTLCLGVSLLGRGPTAHGGISLHELGWMWAAGAVLSAVVLLGSRRIVGAVLLAAYLAFIVLELAGYQ